MLYAQHWLFFVGTRDLYVGWCFWLSLFLCVFAVWCFVNFCAESIWEVKIWAWSGKFWEGFPVVCAGEGYLWCALAQSICGFFILPCKSLQQRVCLAGLMLPFSVFACVHLSHIVQIMESRGSSSCLFMDSVWIWLSWKGKFKEAAVWWPSASCLQKIEGDRSNSVEVISGDKFNISSIYMLICCTMNTKYVCYPYRVTFCGVSFLDWWELYTFMILKFGNKRLKLHHTMRVISASLYVSIYNCYGVFTTSQFFSAWFFLISLCIFWGFHPTVLPLADG
jgi:hypothetical protein